MNTNAEKTEKEVRTPSFAFSLLVMAVICIVVIAPYMLWNISMAATFFLAWLLVIPACMYLGHSYASLEKAAITYCQKVISSAFIVMAVGGMIGTWIAAGTVPSIIYLGLQLITPKFFLLVTFITCTAYAIACGTSWGTLGTIGVAMSAVGVGLGVPPAMTAGAIVSAAFLGDGFSPMSDSPNLASAVTGVNLIEYVRHLSKIQIPAFLISCVLYAILGMSVSADSVQNEIANQIIATLGGTYRISFVSFVPAVVVIVLLVMKKSAIVSILMGAVTGGLVAVFYQGQSLSQALGNFWSGYKSGTGIELVDTLLSRGGVTSLLSSVALYMITFGLIGILTKAGILDSVIAPLVRVVKGTFQLLLTTMVTGIVGNAVGCSGSFAYLFAGNLMAPIYKKMNVDPLDLTRALGCSVTPTGPLIPWNINAVIALDLLGVSCLAYAPYCFQAYTMPVLFIIISLLTVRKKSTPVTAESGAS